jgi:hypothetical protein
LPARSGLLINESLHSALPVNEPVFRRFPRVNVYGRLGDCQAAS